MYVLQKSIKTSFVKICLYLEQWVTCSCSDALGAW